MKIKITSLQSKIFLILLACILVISSGHVLRVIIPGTYLLPIFSSLLVIIPIIRYLNFCRIKIVDFSLILFIILPIFTGIINKDISALFYIVFICTVITAFGITLFITKDDFIKYYIKVMDFTTIVALIGYYLINYSSLLSFLPNVYNTNGVEYKFGLLFTSITVIPERNCGMFWEPGLFATYLIIGIIIELLSNENKINLKRLTLYSLGIFTAHSSAGYALLLLCFLLYLFLRNRQLKNNSFVIKSINWIALIMSITVICNYELIIASTNLANNQYFQKLMFDNMSNSSRFLAIYHNLNLFCENPLFGSGIIRVSSAMQYVADTSTSTYLMAIFGLGGISYSFLWIYAILKTNVNIYSKLILLVLTFSILNKEPHGMMILSWYILFILLRSKPDILKRSVYKD